MILDHDRDGDRVGHRPVVGQHGGIVRPGEGRRGEHDRVRPGRLGLAGEGDCAVRPGVAHPDAHRQVAGRGEDAIDDRSAFVVAQAPGLAEDAQDGHAVDAAVRDEAGERRQAVGVQRPVGRERRRDDRPDPLEPLDAAPGGHR